MVERHLDGVAHLCNLSVEATDVRVGHVRDLRGQQLLDVLPHDAFQGDARANVHDQGIPGAQVPVAQRTRQLQQGLRATLGGHEHAVSAHHSRMETT